METPLLRVSRPVSACARCRNAKIRCDGRLPACSACERAGKAGECSSASDSFAKGKERSYVASLELRAERLLKQIAQAKAENTGILQKEHYRNHRLAAQLKRPSQITEASDVDDLVSDFGYLVLNATSTGYNGFDKEMSFARLVISTATMESLPTSDTSGLPSRESALALTQICMQNVFALYPILTETSIYGAIESVYQRGGAYSSPADVWNVRLIIAIGLLCKSTSKDDTNYRAAVGHVAVALEQAEAVLQPGITSTTQAIMLLGLYSMFDSDHFSPWYLLSTAVRVWLDIGLHQEPAHLKRPPHVVQNHRRLFYCLYSLDRIVTFSHVRLLSFTDDSVDVDLPELTSSFSFDNGEAAQDDSFVLLTKFRQTASMYYQRLFGSRRDVLYESWFNRPQDIVSLKAVYSTLTANSTEAQKHILALDLHHLTILLLRPLETQIALDTYGIHLLFDAAMAYSQSFRWLLQSSEVVICCTSLELLRATRVARQLLVILYDHSCPVFEDVAPRQPPSLLANHFPGIIKRSRSQSISAVVDFCTDMKNALNTLGRRFGVQPGHHKVVEDLATYLSIFKTRQHHQQQTTKEFRQGYESTSQYHDNNQW